MKFKKILRLFSIIFPIFLFIVLTLKISSVSPLFLEYKESYPDIVDISSEFGALFILLVFIVIPMLLDIPRIVKELKEDKSCKGGEK